MQKPICKCYIKPIWIIDDEGKEELPGDPNKLLSD